MSSKPPKIQVRTPKDYQKKPWKNGGGTTEELLVHPAGKDDFLWRISVAVIEKSGPFSSYEGYMRVLIPLAGTMILKHDNGSEAKLKKLEPYRFQGGWKTDCTIENGKTQDFNFIYKPHDIAAQVGTMTLKNSLKLRLNGDTDFLYCADGEIFVMRDGIEEPTKVGSHGLCELQASATNQVITIKPVGAQGVALIHLSLKNRT